MPSFRDAVLTALSLWESARESNRAPTTMTLLGPPGIGKSAVGEEVARQMTAAMKRKYPHISMEAAFARLDLTASLPEDLVGLPILDKEKGEARFAVPSVLKPFLDPNAFGVLVLDDLPAAPRSVQVATRQLALYHRVGEHVLSDSVLVIVTGNRREDKSGATTLPAHFRNATVLLTLLPNVEEWGQWYLNQGYPPEVLAFVKAYPQHFSATPDKADKLGAFPTPRSWALLARDLKHLRHLPRVAVQDVAAGFVGEGAAAEFTAFLDVVIKLPPAKDILLRPEETIPNVREYLDSTDKHIATVVAVATLAGRSVATARSGHTKVPSLGGLSAAAVAEKFLRATAHICQGNEEYAGMALHTYQAAGGKASLLVPAARSDDDKVKSLVNFIYNAVEA